MDKGMTGVGQSLDKHTFFDKNTNKIEVLG